jgi:hypothetical protein
MRSRLHARSQDDASYARMTGGRSQFTVSSSDFGDIGYVIARHPPITIVIMPPDSAESAWLRPDPDPLGQANPTRFRRGSDISWEGSLPLPTASCPAFIVPVAERMRAIQALHRFAHRSLKSQGVSRASVPAPEVCGCPLATLQKRPDSRLKRKNLHAWFTEHFA